MNYTVVQMSVLLLLPIKTKERKIAVCNLQMKCCNTNIGMAQVVELHSWFGIILSSQRSRVRFPVLPKHFRIVRIIIPASMLMVCLAECTYKRI